VAPGAAGLPEHVEAARRGALLTLINHGGPAIEVDVAGVDTLTGERVARVRLDAYDLAMVLTD
jgi:beta-galactosidase